jgi:hypothetical protein
MLCYLHGLNSTAGQVQHAELIAKRLERPALLSGDPLFLPGHSGSQTSRFGPDRIGIAMRLCTGEQPVKKNLQSAPGRIQKSPKSEDFSREPI